jgi:hypothetical protein
MSDEAKCTEAGCMTPAQVVRCAEDSNTECWYAATMIAEDGSEVAYECCGGGGKKARFSLLRKGAAARAVDPADVPSSLTWVRRPMA